MVTKELRNNGCHLFLVGAQCDNCGCNVRLDSDSDWEKSCIDCGELADTPGRYFRHVGGYGTKYDSEVIERVFCDKCIFEKVMK